VKLAIVARDEQERGERRKLNFGHTLGHAVEKTFGLSHGEAVSIGMAMEARLSMLKGFLTSPDVVRIKRMLVSYGLPVAAQPDKEAIIDAVRKDKKREGEEIHCVLLNGIGEARIERVGIQELEEVFDDLCEHC
jgi:3-dehydroquinate synthase